MRSQSNTCMAILSPSFGVAFWHLTCCRMTAEAIEVRRGVYILLTIFLVQLSGLRALCLPSRGQTHACCPVNTKNTLPSSSSLPDCCLSSLLNYQGSITEMRNSDRPSESTAQSGAMSLPSSVPLVAINAVVLQHVLPSISPPRSPLSQTCLLLI